MTALKSVDLYPLVKAGYPLFEFRYMKRMNEYLSKMSPSKSFPITYEDRCTDPYSEST